MSSSSSGFPRREARAAHGSGPVAVWRPAPSGSAPVVRVAWLTTIMISSVPSIVSFELTRVVPNWLPAAQVGVLAALLLVSVFWPVLAPLRSFGVVMIAVVVLLFVQPRINLNWPPLPALFGSTAFDARMQAEQTSKLAVSLVVIGVLLLLGYRRRDFFLTVGDLRAPIRPVRLLGFPRPNPWWQFGLQWSIYIATALGVVLYLTAGLTAGSLLAVAPMLPSILFYAALNAFNEEMTYRAPMLATLEPVVGSTQALWLSAGLFALAHYFGTPGGLLGAAVTIFMGWILGKAMLETRGMFWSWWIHFLSDVVIFVFLAASLAP